MIYRKVLVVDDNGLNRQILSRMLRDEYDVLEAQNGREALDILNRAPESISAVLLDLMMPEMDGFEVLKRMRRIDELKQIPIIVATGNTEEGAEIKALSLGANDYISKPYNLEIIRHRLCNTINLRENAAVINAAKRDKLTGLFSREAYFERAAELIASHEPSHYVMSSMNVENFKVINDQYGTEKGDEVLKYIAGTICAGFEPVGGICCRIMADKFSALYPVSFMETDAIVQIRHAIKLMDGSIHPIAFNIGRYIVDDVTLSVDAMYDRATLAEATVKGRYDVHIAEYNESMRDRLIREQKVANEMRFALKNGQFEIWPQPQYNHATGALVGAEALVRWRDPKSGKIIPPSEFIPVFERNGFIYEMDKFVWEQACIALRRWLDAGDSPLPMSVNISRLDAFHDDFYDYITGLIKKYAIPVELLRLEVTETAFANSTEQIVNIVRRLLDYGFIVEIDDFGSGYSSLNTLKDVPANILKLDMKFLENTENAKRGGNILESIVRMARWLGMSVIAEGVETVLQADFLKSIGCNYVQGYLYAKPMPLDEYEALVLRSKRECSMLTLETVGELDKNAFWDPKSMETLVFNSYVGGACVFEYCNGKSELLRMNDKYPSELGVDYDPSEPFSKLDPENYLDEENLLIVQNNILNAIKTNDESSCEIRVKRSGENEGDAYVRSTVRFLARAEERYLFYCSVINITAQRIAEQKERELSEQLRVIMDNVDGGVSAVTFDENGAVHFIFANERYYSMLGYTKAQFDAEVKNVLFRVHPEDRERTLQSAARVVNDCVPAVYEYRCIRRDGDIINVRCNASITRIKGIEENVLLSVNTDITELVDAEHKAVSTSERLQAIMDNVDCGITAITLDENDSVSFIFVNDKYCELLGYTRRQYAEEVGEGFARIEPEDLEYVLPRVRETRNTGCANMVEFRAIRRDGSRIWLRDVMTMTTFVGIDEPVQLSIFTDITVEKLAADELRETDEQLRFLNDVAHELLSQAEVDKVIERVLRKLLKYFGGNRAYIIENDYKKQVTNNTYEVCAEGVKSERDDLMGVPFESSHIWRNLLENDGLINISDIGAFAGGDEKLLLARQNISSLIAVPLKRDGKIIGSIGIDDPTQQQTNVDRLGAIGDYIAVMLTRRDLNAKIADDSKAMLSLMNDTPGGFVRIKVVDNTSALVYANDGFCRLVGMTNDEVMALYGSDSTAGVHPDDIEAAQKAAREMFATGRLNAKYRLRHGKNGYVWLFAFGQLSKEVSGDVFVNIYYADVSEQNRQEEQRRRLIENLPGGVGIYHVYPDERVEKVYLNDGYYSMIGVDREDRTDYNGFDTLGAIHPDDLPGILDEVRSGIRERRKIKADLRILVSDGKYKWFNIRANVADKTEEHYVLYATYSDIDQLKNTQLRLEASQRILQIANIKGRMSVWLYYLNTNIVKREALAESELGYPECISNVPESLMEGDSVFHEDKAEYHRIYEEMLAGAENSECTVRLKNITTGAYEWQHVTYTRLTDEYYGERVALGTAVNVDIQQENQQRYERELQLRRELIRESISYYQLNITTGIIEEYYARKPQISGMKANVKVSEELRAEILAGVVPEDRERVRNTIFSDALFESYLRDELTVTLTYRRYLTDEGVRWIRATVTIMERPNTGEVIAFIHSRDIDMEKKNQLAIESIVDEEIESVVVLNVKTRLARIVQVQDGKDKPEAQAQFAYGRDYRENMRNHIVEEDTEICDTFFDVADMTRALENEPVIKIMFRVKDEDGRILRKKTRAFYLDETKEDIILIRRDITDLYEEEQRQKRSLQKAVEAANEASNAKSQFLSRMSHDIRTPLTAILAMSGDEMTEDATAEQKDEYLEKIHSSGKYLLGILNDVLDMSRAESKKAVLQLAPYPISDFRDTINTVIGEQCREKGVNFVFNVSGFSFPWAMLDKVHFNQLFVNLLSNAVKFTPTGGTVEFAVECIEKVGNRVKKRFIVRDNGIGMSKEFLPHAFESFAQERREGVSENNLGTGLGLSIVKQIVEMMDGTIAVESEPGKGTTFTVELSYEGGNSELAGTTAYQTDLSVLKGIRILLCEDHPLNTRIVTTMLTKRGCVVESAENGKLGLELFEKSASGYYDIVLMDIRMPIMDGLETTKAIRALDRDDAKHIPIIALTADAFNEDAQTSIDVGMNGHVAKPIDAKLLYSMIAKLVGDRRQN